MENSDQVLNSNISQEQKNSLMLDYIKDSRINSNTEPFERLLNCGVSPDLTNGQGKSILMMAAEKGSLVLVQHLIEEAKADIQMRDSYNKTALSYAIEAGTENADVITYLLRFKANPNTQSNDGKTPLILAVEKGYHKTAEALLYKGSNPNTTIPRTGDNALHIAARKGDERMVGLLLQYNCDLNRKNKKNETGLELCSNNPRLKDFVQPKLPPAPKIQVQHVQQMESSPMNNANDVVNAIEQFRQVMNKNANLDDPNEEEGDIQQQQQQENIQDQTGDTLRPQNKPDYRRYSQQQQQQQQQQQKRASQQQMIPSQQKVDREPPKRKYPGRGEALNIKRANSNNETAQTETSETSNTNTSTTNNFNPLESPSTITSSPQKSGANRVEEIPNVGRPLYRFPTDETPSYPAQSNSQYSDENQQQYNRPSIVKTPSGEYPDQFSPKPPGPNVYMNNPQMNQMRGNMSPGFYNNQQFLINSPNIDMNNPQQSNKRKPKGQMSHTVGPNMVGPQNIGPNTPNMPNKNFPAPTNPGFQNNQNFVQSPNMPYNQRQGGQDLQQQRIQGNNPNKFNRNQERSFTDISAGQRGLGSPNTGFQPPLKNIPSVPNMPGEMGMAEGIKPQNEVEKAPMQENIKMVKGGRPQQQYQQQQQQFQQQFQHPKFQQQPPPMNSPGNNNMIFSPNSPYTDQRGMINSPQGPNPGGMFNPHFVQHQQQQMNLNMNMMGPPNMGPTHFNFNSPSMPMNRNQQQQQQGNMNQMMGKPGGMQPVFIFPNGIQRNMSLGSEPPMYYINLTDPIQKENSELQANYQSMCKEMTRQMKDIDKTNLENTELSKNLNECQHNEKSLQDKIKEREKLIEELKRKNEELEIVVKTITANSPFANRQDFSTVTDSLLTGYEVKPAERVLEEHDMITEFWKHEALCAALSEEVAAFEKSVDEYNEEKKPQFDNLIKLMQGAVREVAADAEFYVYGSFATGLSLPWSDIDIVIKLPQTYYSYTVLDSIENNLKVIFMRRSPLNKQK